MLQVSHLLIFYNLIIWKPCVSNMYYANMGVVDRIRGKLTWMMRELLVDATMKINSTQHFRETLAKTTQFQYGSIIFGMRSRHRRMFQLYKGVLDSMETTPLADDDEYPNYYAELAEMDSLAHDVVNFAAMLKINHANRHADKSKAGYDLFFRRVNEAPAFLELVNSFDNSDSPEPPPEENNLTHTGKRRNGVWHYAIPIE